MALTGGEMTTFFGSWSAPSFGAGSVRPGKPLPAPMQQGKGGPHIVFVDHVLQDSQGSVDIDKDGIPDISHGALVAMVYMRRKPSSRVTLLHSEAPASSMVSGDSIRTGCETRVRSFEKVADALRQGQKVDGVNFSIATANTTLADLAEVTGLPLSPRNAHRYREAIRERLFHLADQVKAGAPLNDKAHRFGCYAQVIRSMEALGRWGVPVHVAAGNEGPGHLNLYSLAKNAVTVGATNAKGEKTAYTADSSHNPFVTEFAQGDFNVRPIQRNGKVVGYDVTGSGKVDIPAHMVSGKGQFVHPALRYFVGQRAKEVQASQQELAQIKRLGSKQALSANPSLAHKVVPIEIYGQLKGYGSERIRKMKSQGGYITLDGQWTFRSRWFSGRLYYSPDGTRQDGAINAIRGSSFATPVAMR